MSTFAKETLGTVSTSSRRLISTTGAIRRTGSRLWRRGATMASISLESTRNCRRGGRLPAGRGNLFSVLDIQPALGRDFRPEEDRLGANQVVLLSWSLFQRRFAGDPSVIGK